MRYDSLKDKTVVLFGAGEFGRIVLEELMKSSIKPAYFVDNNICIRNINKPCFFNGFEINSPDVLLLEEKKNLRIIITPGYPQFYEIKSQLIKMGLEDQIFSSRIGDYAKLMIIDLIDRCNLKCPTCARGLGVMPTSSKRMDKMLYKDILLKGRTEGYSRVALFNWSEPFLNTDLVEYIKIAKQENMSVLLSSNLSIKKIAHFEEVLATGVDHLTISISGDTQEIYQINHRGGNIDLVYNNIHLIFEMLQKKRINTKICLKFLKFTYNHSSEEKLAQIAKTYGINFKVHPGCGNPLNKDDYNLKHMLEQLVDYESNEDPDYNNGVCELMLRHVAIDYKGMTYLGCCNANVESTLIGKYLDLDSDYIFAKRYAHHKCVSCKWKRIPLTNKEVDKIRENVNK